MSKSREPMEPQAPQTTPENQPVVVPDTGLQTAPQAPFSSNPTPKKSKLWLVVVLVVVAVLIVAGVVFALLQHDSGTKANKKTGDKTQQLKTAVTAPDYGNIKVGSYRYVNACQAFPATEEEKVFAGLAGSALLDATYAENTLPATSMSSSDKVTSSCSREYGSDTPYDGTFATFQIDQYTTTAAARKVYDTYNVSQSDLDKANQRFGGSLTTHTAPMPGAENTVYNSESNSSYTIDGNKIISFSALLGQITPEQFQQAIAAALPAVLANVHNSKLSQQLNQDSTFGQKIGDSTYQNPCQFFTDADFKAMTGGPDNPTNVQLEYNYRATTDFFTDISNGEANNNCTRYTYPGATHGRSIKASLDYFKSAAEANQTVQQNFTRLSGKDGEKLQQLTGLGQYAYFRQTTDGSDLTYLDAQKGPYILELTIDIPSGTPTVTDYTKAANVLLPKLQ